jgi:hypothetical protein
MNLNHSDLFLNLNQLFDSCIVTDPDGAILFINPIALELFGAEIRNSIGKHLCDVMEFKTAPIEQKIIEDFVTIKNQPYGPFQIKKYTNKALTLFLMRDTSIEINIHKKYKEKTRSLIKLNEEQEQIIELRTSHLSFTNKLLENVVSLSDQMILNFDMKGVLLKAFPESGKLNDHFQRFELYQLLDGAFTQSQTTDWLMHLQLKTLPIEDLIELAPESITIAGIHYAVTFHLSEIAKMDPLLVVILRDLTKEEFLIDQASKKNELINSIYKASIHQDVYLDTIKETNHIFETIKHTSDTSEIKRKLHTLRGSLSCFGPDGLEQKVKSLETRETFNSINDEIDLLKKDYQKRIDALFKHLPHLKLETIMLPRAVIRDIANGKQTVQTLRQYDQLNLSKVITSFENYIRELSEASGYKVRIKMNLEVQNLYLDHKFNTCITQFLIHGIRNSFAHIFRQEIENSIELKLTFAENIVLCIESVGLVQKPNTELGLSGQGQGLKLVEDLAQANSSQTSLVISEDKKKSFYTLRIPKECSQSL